MTDKRIAFVTGGSRGIGAAIVQRLARDGFHVVAVARSLDKLEALCGQIKSEGGSAEAMAVDIADPKALAAAIEKTAETHGRLDVLVNNAGLIGLSKSVAKELAGKNITCNVVAPGFVTTDMTDSLNDAIKEKVKEIIPLKRFGQPGEIAGVVAFLAGPDSTYVTGQVIVADGGMVM